MAYNKSEIMWQAWSWYKNEDLVMGDIEWSDYRDLTKTFANCLKAAWAKAKEDAEEAVEFAKEIAKSQQLKAWNWAEKKLNVKIDATDEQKWRWVTEEENNMWTVNTFKAGILAVETHLRLFGTEAVA